MRCFVAIRLPDQINQELGRHIRYLEGAGAAVRWVKEDTLHVTLKFLGDVQDDEIKAVHHALSEVRRAAMSLSVQDLGCFPPKGKPRVVWAGLAGDTDALASLAADIDARVGPLGYPPEQRAFRAHLTIGRVKGPRNLDQLMLAIQKRGGQLSTPAVEIDAFTLYQSELGKAGPRYYKIGSYPLAPAGD